ncbi:hypothetical protein ACFQ0K_13215 [Nocardioides caeni]|uniref:GerMN domain-containing protein n=1 Tax=Nocardioides caeni TaxID=574700 RepID=A0A4S8NQ10_9ACTN|nr:hypothetical protein [Nocardioides caeni]THV17634.1 hypothetical protein E9934_03890 [Nocardioides caeni]
MSPDQHDDDLRALLHGAVDDIDPADRLGEIRRRTAARNRSRRHWPLVLVGAGTATAAVVGFAALAGQLGGGDEPGPEPAAPNPRQAAVAAYFIDDTFVDGQRLFREFHAVAPSDEPAVLALEALRLLEVDAGPLDPDYGTVWSDGSFVDVSLTDDRIVVTLDSARPTASAVALQQVVLTVQAAFAVTTPVTFAAPGAADQEVPRDPSLLAAVNITDPVEGHEVDDLLTLRGIVGPDARDLPDVAWQLRADGDAVVRSGSAPIDNGTWEVTTDIADLADGDYELAVTVQYGVDSIHTDTRTVTVR